MLLCEKHDFVFNFNNVLISSEIVLNFNSYSRITASIRLQLVTLLIIMIKEGPLGAWSWAQSRVVVEEQRVTV